MSVGNKTDFTLNYNLEIRSLEGFSEDDFKANFDLKQFNLYLQAFRVMSGSRYIVRNSDNVVLIESEMSQVHD